ncbi:hypothetical protein CRG98_012530 [Punica granatum]|uniref:NAD-dependent epimerase/dehydratase domain-containing protein n=1 Tax=Punica granatum TaxID=22663 RepID=A0A2I0KF27_PUNGR|nr:hypothetical protein CRG98_012530 [Punica granatum]
MRLLERGYSVRATIRPSTEKLQIFTADLSDPESFSEAIEGCTGVFHVATPLDFREPEQVMTQRALDGTLGILKASLKSKTVKRVIYTSSAYALCVNTTGAATMDESYWSDVEYIRAAKLNYGSYMISKTLSEKAALEFGESNGLDVVTIVPPFVTGPFVCDKLPDSVRISMAMIFGNQDDYPYLGHTCIVHVDDLASAHIFLFEHPCPKGRYICSSDVITTEKMSKFLTEKYPNQFPVPCLHNHGLIFIHKSLNYISHGRLLFMEPRLQNQRGEVLIRQQPNASYNIMELRKTQLQPTNTDSEAALGHGISRGNLLYFLNYLPKYRIKLVDLSPFN